MRSAKKFFFYYYNSLFAYSLVFYLPDTWVLQGKISVVDGGYPRIILGEVCKDLSKILPICVFSLSNISLGASQFHVLSSDQAPLQITTNHNCVNTIEVRSVNCAQPLFFIVGPSVWEEIQILNSSKMSFVSLWMSTLLVHLN